MTRRGIELVLEHSSGCRDPLASPHEWYVLIELSSQQRQGTRQGTRLVLEEILEQALERGLVTDAAVADSLEQTKAFWRIREMFGEVQRHAGGSIKHDVSVPVASVPAFIAEANAAVTKLIPGARPLPFGHLGDGNIHYNVTQPVDADKAEYLKRWDEVNATVFAVVKKFGGSISAEHGIGVMKRDLLPAVKDPVALELMHSIKNLLDPNGILNPGKVL
jgi:FAD/FMN-containing dehydrogenase